MMNVQEKDIRNVLTSAFESGYSNAAKSLSQLTKRNVTFNNFHNSLHRVDSISFPANIRSKHDSSGFLVTTELFGDLIGKSYLLLSDVEYDLITAGIPESNDPSIDLREEFIKEVDNILSASVITKLSNELELKMYGDVPLSMGKVKGKIEDIIYDDFYEDNDEIYVNSSFFSFDNQPAACPLFVWVLTETTQKLLVAKSAIKGL